MDRGERGRWAEQAAARELEGRGFTILGRNVRLQRGELDLVVGDGERLWFVEIKSRGRRDRGPPHRAIDARKRRALFAAAREYLARSRFAGDWGFLVASVLPHPVHGHPVVCWDRLPVAPPTDPEDR